MFRITGYVDRFSARPGETIGFKVNCEFEHYKARIVRLICGDASGHGPGYKDEHVVTEIEGSYPGRIQTINAGSYVNVASQPGLEKLDDLSISVMIWPTTPELGRQTIIGKWDDVAKSGFRLSINDKREAEIWLGDGCGQTFTLSARKPLIGRNWYHVSAAVSGQSKEVTVSLHPGDTRYEKALGLSTVRETLPCQPDLNNRCPVFIAAAPEMADGEIAATRDHYNGKIDAPMLFGKFVETAELQPGHVPPAPTLAHWDFSKGISTARAVDVSGNGFHGDVVNLPARAMTGWNWAGDIRCWTDAPEQYGAIHFHDDDLYDAGWEDDFRLAITPDLRPGLYAAHLTAENAEMHLPFVVRPERGREGDIAFLMPVFDYMAYGNERLGEAEDFVKILRGRDYKMLELYEFLNAHPEYGKSLYDLHSDGSGVCYSSRLRPIMQMRPKCQVPWATADTEGRSCNAREFNFDTFFVDWLEHLGVNYNVLTDEDLNQEGYEAISRYRVLITGAHPEYYTKTMLDAVARYTDDGGRLMYLGGNGFYWVVATNDEFPGAIEVRRFGDATKTWVASPGEYHCSLSGEYGSLWRHNGRAPQKVGGVGFTSEGFDVSTHYKRQPGSHDPRAAFIFEGIDDDILGDFGYHGGGAVGNEIDRVDFDLGTPPHALILATGDDLSDLYYVTQEDTPLNAPKPEGRNPLNRADMTFFETPNGGAVFAVGSIAYVGSLCWNNYDNNIAQLTENVLRRFLDPELFDL